MSDELGCYAHPRATLDARNTAHLLKEIKHISEQEQVSCFVVGLPLNQYGREGQAATRIRTFAQTLADATGCNVVLWDERFSTVEASRRLREVGMNRKAMQNHVDAAAAVAILQSYLDAQKTTVDDE